MLRLASIVEGHGDAAAIPVLFRRLSDHLSLPIGEVLKPIRIPKQRLMKAGELERAVELAARQTGPGDAIFILVDADTDCPATVGPQLLRRAVAVHSDRRIAAVLAKSEFEAWLVAAAGSIAGRRGLSSPLLAPNDPESIRDAKGWLSRHCRSGFQYRETLDQEGLAAVFDLNVARASSSSFDKLCRELEALRAP